MAGLADSPSRKLRWLSAGLALLVLGAYLAVWVSGHRAYLFDPAYQSDDARTHLFRFHGFEGNSSFEGDAVADEMGSMMTPAVWLAYRASVPWLGLHASVKIVQALALLLVLVAGALLAGSERGGLGAGLLLVFLFLRAPDLVTQMAGGLPRGFAYPVLCLWLAGALAERARVRWVAVLVATVTYPPAAALALGAEGLLALWDGARARELTARGRRFALLLAGVLLVVGAQSAANRRYGPVVDRAAAEASGAFGPRGRLGSDSGLPLPDPRRSFRLESLRPFAPGGEPLSASLAAGYRALRSWGPALIVAGLLVAVITRVAPVPLGAAAMLVAAVLLYVIARVLAFKLYAPQRYLGLGLPCAMIGLAVVAAGGVLPRLAGSGATVRNIVAAGLMVLLWAAAGDGVHPPPRDGMLLHGGRYPSLLTVPQSFKVSGLFEALRALPQSARIAAHPDDGDDLPLWGERATTPSYETLQPWFTGSWQRLRVYAEETLSALYATRQGDLLAYCERRRVTHLLLNRYRYGRRFRQNAISFEPLGSFIRARLRGIEGEDLVLATVPARAVRWAGGAYLLVEVAALRRAWAQGA